MHFHQFIVKMFFIILMRTWVSLWSGKAICWFLHNANIVALTGISNLPSHLKNSFSSQKMFKALRTTCSFLLSKLLWFSEIHGNWDMCSSLLSTKGVFKVSFFSTFFFRLFTNLLTYEITLNSFGKELNLLMSITFSIDKPESTFFSN